MNPIKLQRMKRTNCWKPAGPVWFQKNNDRIGKILDEGIRQQKEIDKMEEEHERRERRMKRQQKRIEAIQEEITRLKKS